jgi:hypothetical protein
MQWCSRYILNTSEYRLGSENQTANSWIRVSIEVLGLCVRKGANEPTQVSDRSLRKEAAMPSASQAQTSVQLQ